MTTKYRGLKIAGKSAAALKSMLRTQVTQLIKYERIETTLTKAKLVKRFADKMVTLGKKGTPIHYQHACAFVREKEMVDKLFGEFAERYEKRNGGYTRVIRTRRRRGDAAQMAYIEYIDRPGEIRKPRPPPDEEEKQRRAAIKAKILAGEPIEAVEIEDEPAVVYEAEAKVGSDASDQTAADD
eukprot:CAMPEP_0197527310 /NCGR_PEP_ID=MMETSP1318-20131121/21047_1 /TAXON_ID=552666 /ORGANISM="Partenskyella glossopodia, Strain RCC365" /LENGTH=182 /DNA_ID=CAMNT_0043081879 /DNA_START=27 /DNA_END=572 /DNA_ORIENTATION=+